VENVADVSEVGSFVDHAARVFQSVQNQNRNQMLEVHHLLRMSAVRLLFQILSAQPL
jgi:hypothetical protein